MHKILILGAGRSSTTLIQHLLNTTSPSEFQVTVADENISLAREKIGNREGKAISLNVEDTEKLNTLIQENNLVISMLPAVLHDQIAEVCLDNSRHLVTASYVSEKMQEMGKSAAEKDLIFLNECGLDPGIDHM